MTVLLQETQSHGNLKDLTGNDDHTQYAILAGRAGGQAIIGDTASGGDLVLQSTAHATKGKVIFGLAGTTVYDEVNDRLGIGVAPTVPLEVKSSNSSQVIARGDGIEPRIRLYADSTARGQLSATSTYGLVASSETSLSLTSNGGSGAGNHALIIDASGNVGIGTESPVATLSVGGITGSGGLLNFAKLGDAGNGDAFSIVFNEVSGDDSGVALVYNGSSANPTINSRAYTLPANTFGIITNSGAADTLALSVARATGIIAISSLTASLPVFTDASKNLVSNTVTGTGDVVMSASPTLTGTITAAAAYFSSTVSIGDAAPGNALLTVEDLTIDTTSTYYGLYNKHTKTDGVTDDGDVLYGIYNDVEFNQAGGTIGHLRALYTRATLTAGTIGGNNDFATTYFDGRLEGGTVADNVYNTFSRLRIDSGVTIGGDVYGHYIDVDSDSTPTGDVYMLYLKENTGIDYGIYQDGTAPNLFGGALTITGLLTANGNIVIPDDGTIGSASATSAITIDSSGNVIVAEDVVMAAGKSITINNTIMSESSDILTVTLAACPGTFSIINENAQNLFRAESDDSIGIQLCNANDNQPVSILGTGLFSVGGAMTVTGVLTASAPVAINTTGTNEDLHITTTGNFNSVRMESTDADGWVWYTSKNGTNSFSTGITGGGGANGDSYVISSGDNLSGSSSFRINFGGKVFIQGGLDVTKSVNTTASFIGITNSNSKTAGVTDASDTFTGFLNSTTVDQSGGVIGPLVGFNNSSNLEDGTVTGDAKGIYNNVSGNGASVTADVYGIHNKVAVVGADSGANVYGHYIDVGSNGAPSGTAYMLYLNEGANVDYGIYQNGTAPNLFGGVINLRDSAIGIYSQADTYMDLFADGAVRIGDSSAGAPTNYSYFAPDGHLNMVGTAKVIVNDTFVFNYANVSAQGKPTLVNRGVFYGWSLPVYNSDDEELFSCRCIDSDWDGTTDPTITVGGWLDTANDTKKFQLQVSVDVLDIATNEVVPTSTNDYPIETTTGSWAQYASFKATVTIDASGIVLAAGKALAVRIRRIAASVDEITGEVVIEGAMLSYVADKIGAAT